jgi:hypothetical protein
VKKNAEVFLKKTLGEDFLESLGKSEIFQPNSKAALDTSDLFQGLQIVPRALLNLLVQELSPMQTDDNKEVKIPGKEDTTVMVTRHGRDDFSGQVIQNNVKIYDFLHRSIPGLGLVLLSVLELYNIDELTEKAPEPSKEIEINRIIDERMSLHSLVNKVVDGKMMHRDAVQQLFMAKLNQLQSEHKQSVEDRKEIVAPKPTPEDEPAHVAVITLAPKKRPLSEFVESRKKKLAKKEFSIEMAKSETRNCPDCNGEIFNGSGISSCMCYGSDMGKKVFLKKTEDGIKVSFPASWSAENIQMLLEVLRDKENG